MSAINIHDAPVSLRHGVDQAVKSCPSCSTPAQARTIVLSRSAGVAGWGRTWLNRLIPKELSEILMWTEGGTGHGADVVVLEEVVRDPGRVWMGVVLPQMVFPWRPKKLWDGFGARALGQYAATTYPRPRTRF